MTSESSCWKVLSSPEPELFAHRRQLHYRPGVYLIVQDELTARTELPFVSRLQVAHDLDVRQTSNGFVIRREGTTDIRVELRTSGCELDLVRGRSKPSYLGWEAIGYEKMTRLDARGALPGRERKIEWAIGLTGVAAP